MKDSQHSNDFLVESQGSVSDPILNHPHRAVPNPVDGSLLVDPEIVLKALGMGLTIEFFYSSTSTRNDQFGKNRSASVNAYVIPDPEFGGLSVWRGNEKAFAWSVFMTIGGITYYTPSTGTYSPTTMTYNGTSYTEQFPDGSQLQYETQNAGAYLLTRAIAPAGPRQTFTYGTGAEVGLLKTIQVTDGRKVTFTYSASSPTSLLSSVQDWGGRFWTFQYDTNRQLTTMSTPLGCQTGFSYATFSGATRLSGISDPAG